ncbi:hypothetical protein JIN84_21125 [Luteolibacter yonseiensis]|uniref:Uncharacterized protein n=1 Tax=Luteolibacter yonseiensis TaxID=1144680 RepID=A0A934VE13_9BACT|nr:hypothetical protein [Luteolibacter yonseiensis]MBK1818139.1 hypothetical protein [Luteolibacter yonseiensis]
MSRTIQTVLLTGLLSSRLWAGTVVITSVADPGHPQAPLTSLAGLPLVSSTQVHVGAFPGMSDDQILDLASHGGLSGITTSFTPFGGQCAIGQGVDGAPGGFEIAVKSPVTSTSPCAGQTVSLLIRTAGGEFLVARFPGKVFEPESPTGLEPLLSLHLADAKLLVGNRLDVSKFTTSTAPPVGSFGTWLSGFPTITDPLMKLPGADPDSDGRSNFLEYATGGNPTTPDDPAAGAIRAKGTEGVLWVTFQRLSGLGTVRYSLESSQDLAPPWSEFVENLEADPEFPNTLRAVLTPPLTSNRYFRLKVEGEP